MNVGAPELIFILIFGGLFVAVWFQIFKKTGNSGWLSLLMFIPLVNLIMLLYLAFSDWPILRELRSLHYQIPAAPPTPASPQS